MSQPDWGQSKHVLGDAGQARPRRVLTAALTWRWPGTVLAAAGTVPLDGVRWLVLLGELGLDGSVRGIRGVLPAVRAASRACHRPVLASPPTPTRRHPSTASKC